MELTLEISGEHLKDISGAFNKMPRNSAVLYNDETSHSVQEPHFKGILKMKNERLFWAFAWLRKTHKGRLVLELTLEPKHVKEQEFHFDFMKNQAFPLDFHKFDNAAFITEEEAFYGYIIGLMLTPIDGEHDSFYMLALFEYNGDQAVYRIPDIQLYKLLSNRLRDGMECSLASEISTPVKLWTKKENGKWYANEP